LGKEKLKIQFLKLISIKFEIILVVVGGTKNKCVTQARLALLVALG